MIEKLSKRIFYIIAISLSIVLLGIIISFSVFSYTNTINSSTLFLDRFMVGNKKIIGEREDFGMRPPVLDMQIEGLYVFQIQNNKVINTNEIATNKVAEEYAIKLSNGNSENGIIGNYIYKIRKNRDMTTVALMENENVIMHTQLIIAISVISCIISLVVVYVVAKKLSKLIVQPINETFNKQKQFISDASHELKTPLAVIEANTDVLENEIGDNKWLNYIQKEIDSMDKLINELLLLAKMENVDDSKEYKNTNISKEVEIITSMFESMAYEKKVSLKNEIEENINLNCNKLDIEHILSTLVDNAIKHSEEGKEVIVKLEKDKNNIILQVKNEGEKIPDEEKEKIFERFYRIDKSRNRNEKRYGLGLAIAKSTVQKYKGNIEVFEEGEYTVFKASIPA